MADGTIRSPFLKLFNSGQKMGQIAMLQKFQSETEAMKKEHETEKALNRREVLNLQSEVAQLEKKLEERTTEAGALRAQIQKMSKGGGAWGTEEDPARKLHEAESRVKELQDRVKELELAKKILEQEALRADNQRLQRRRLSLGADAPEIVAAAGGTAVPQTAPMPPSCHDAENQSGGSFHRSKSANLPDCPVPLRLEEDIAMADAPSSVALTSSPSAPEPPVGPVVPPSKPPAASPLRSSRKGENFKAAMEKFRKMGSGPHEPALAERPAVRRRASLAPVGAGAAAPAGGENIPVRRMVGKISSAVSAKAALFSGASNGENKSAASALPKLTSSPTLPAPLTQSDGHCLMAGLPSVIDLKEGEQGQVADAREFGVKDITNTTK